MEGQVAFCPPRFRVACFPYVWIAKLSSLKHAQFFVELTLITMTFLRSQVQELGPAYVSCEMWLGGATMFQKKNKCQMIPKWD